MQNLVFLYNDVGKFVFVLDANNLHRINQYRLRVE